MAHLPALRCGRIIRANHRQSVPWHLPAGCRFWATFRHLGSL